MFEVSTKLSHQLSNSMIRITEAKKKPQQPANNQIPHRENWQVGPEALARGTNLLKIMYNSETGGTDRTMQALQVHRDIGKAPPPYLSPSHQDVSLHLHIPTYLPAI